MSSFKYAQYDANGDSLDNQLPYAKSLTLAQTAKARSITGTTVETALASIIIPGKLLGPNGFIRVTPMVSVTGSTNIKELKIKLGNFTAWANDTGTNASIISMQALISIRNRNANNAQLSTVSFSSGADGNAYGSFNVGAIDTSVDQVLTITGRCSNAADTFTLEAYTVELFPGA